MKKNGFTLAELLGVIVIMAAIALIAFPPIINQIHNSRKDLDKALNDLIFTAAEQYLEENNNKTSDASYCIKLNVLVNDGKLVDPITNSKGEKVPLGSVFYIKYPADNSGNVIYDLYNSDESIPSGCTEIRNS